MNQELPSAGQQPYDAIVIGGGMSGVVFLKYAKEAGLRCRVLEKQNDVGGLWNWIPKWQDIQNRMEDFAIDGIPIDGNTQPAVHDYVRKWVQEFELAPFINLGCEVASASRSNDSWRIRTNYGDYSSKYLIVATGLQNVPWIPAVQRTESAVTEIHSSALERPEELAGKRITVVGGGASALDMLELGTKYGTRKIHWVYHNTRWFFPSSKSKQNNPMSSLRILGLLQAFSRSTETISRIAQSILEKGYARHHLESIRPPYDVDLREHQIFPGRPLMVKNLRSISQHQGEISSMNQHELTLSNGERFETDTILWGTGYRMNLRYLDLPEFREIETVEQLYPRLGSLVRSRDYPSPFMVGMWVIESNTSTPFAVAVQAKSIIAHILGKCEIPMTNIPYHVNYWNLPALFARFDHANYRPFWWRLKHVLLAIWYAVFSHKIVKV